MTGLSLPAPHIHFGRDAEVQRLADTLSNTASSVRVAILGGPGMGKTTLAVAALHHPSVKLCYGDRRYFVPCDAADGVSDSFRLLADAFAIAVSDAQALRRQLRGVLEAGRTLLTLDNFESAWEAADQREDAEQLLQFLGSIEPLSLIITLRGSERPQGVQWSQPFIPPLDALSKSAARQTFLSICDCSDSDPALDTLLDHTDSLPLAVVLLANLAQYEALDALVRRWQEIHTAMLIRGNARTRLTSLDVSLRLAIESPRMETDHNALGLLSLLSLLPYGALDRDIDLWGVGNSARALSVLLRTSLATRLDQRIHVLAPIRSFVLRNHPPTEASLGLACTHFLDLPKVVQTEIRSSLDPQIVASIVPELGNLDCVIRYVLNRRLSYREPAVRAVLALCNVYQDIHIGPGPNLLPLALSVAQHENLEHLEAEILGTWAVLVERRAMDGDPASLYRDAQKIYQRLGDSYGIMFTSVNLLHYLDPQAAVVEGRRLYLLAEEQQDLKMMAICCFRMGETLNRVARTAEAIESLERAIGLFQRTIRPGAPSRQIASCHYRIGDYCRSLNRYNTAVSSYQAALSGFIAARHTPGARDVYMQLADLALNRGDPREAIAQASCALAVEPEETPTRNLRALLVMAEARGLCGDARNATATLERLHELEPPGGYSASEKSHILRARGALALYRGDLTEGRALLQAGLVYSRRQDHICAAITMLQSEAAILGTLSELECAEHRILQAVILAITSAAIFRKTGDSYSTLWSLLMLAEAVDDKFAEQLLASIMLPFLRTDSNIGLAYALLRSAIIAKHRGQPELAKRRVQNALEHMGEVKNERRLRIVREILEE